MSPPASCTANGPVVDSGRDFENEDQIEERSDENEDSIQNNNAEELIDEVNEGAFSSMGTKAMDSVRRDTKLLL